MRRIKEALRKSFAQAAEAFVVRLQKVEQAIGALKGALPVSRCPDIGTSS